MERSPLFNPGEKPTQYIERFWKENISTEMFYHGTSLQSVGSIQQRGLIPGQRPYILDDFRIVNAAWHTIGEERNFSADDAIYLSTDSSWCREYAQAGSENMGALLDQSEFLLTEKLTTLRELDRNLAKELRDLHARVKRYFSFHRPAVFVVRRDSRPLHRVLKRDYPEEYSWWATKGGFSEGVRKRCKDRDMPADTATRDMEDILGEQFADIAIDIPIPPDDLELVLRIP